MIQPLHVLLQKFLQDAIQVGRSLDGVFVGLYKATTGINPNMTLADLTEADYTGYARLAGTPWSADPFISGQRDTIQGPSCLFRPTGSAVTNLVLGMFLVSANVGGNLLSVAPFPAPRAMMGTDDVIEVLPRMAFDPLANYGDNVVG